ncbi:MAG: flagellar basal-body rod protein FlgG [Candidatus Kapabacteria bacterium]|nr:flagellar basal-body rod protein FlgG [Ignavibacteriota bacterium]MCW5885776.1 flagellar basal-body rod protein FlgG [Candidatus Kapabacteria bacterium]
MDKTLRTASTGLAAQQRYVEIISNNLSNINTTGYKKSRPEFQDLLYETLKPAGNSTNSGAEPLNEVQIGSGTELVATKKLFMQGDIKSTENPLDIAINGEGFFVLRRPDNSFVYTRDGSFLLNRNGQVVNSQGHFLEPGINIPNDAVQINMSRDGIVSVVVDGSTDEQTLGQIELARFINPGGLRSLGGNLFTETPASGVPLLEIPGAVNTGEIIQAHLESSNVDIVEEMVNMINAQRAYELNSKSVRTADEILATAVQLKR